jgi:hypothetical protein
MLTAMNEHEVATGRWEPCATFAGDVGARCSDCGWLDDDHRTDASVTALPRRVPAQEPQTLAS